MKAFMNGRIFEEDEPSGFRLDDRGLRHGDGLFETIRVRKGRIEFARAHARRLLASAAALRLPFDGDAARVIEAMRRLIDANEGGDLIVRVTLTRGIAESRLDLDGSPRATFVITATPAPPERLLSMPRPVALQTCSFPRNERSPLARHKSLNYLESLLARDEARRQGADEALLLNTAGRLAEAATANVFVVREDGVLATPASEEGALPGIVRAAVLQSARGLSIAAEKGRVTREELDRAREVFLTNSLIGLVPVASLDGRPFEAGGDGSVIPALTGAVAELAALDSA